MTIELDLLFCYFKSFVIDFKKKKKKRRRALSFKQYLLVEI